MAAGVVVEETHEGAPSVEEVRARIRDGEFTGPTSGVSGRHAQANLVILPGEHAFDFLKFCVRNPRPCPVLEVTDPGSPEPTVTAPGADLRTDLPRYRVFENGELADEPTDVRSYWRGDMVAFLLGCSFTFETALVGAGLRLAHQEQGRNVPMYETNRDCVPSGPFSGPMVVSMRPFKPSEVPLAVGISGRYPTMHGAPVHVGDPASLGIRDLDEPEYGEGVELEGDQMPVFWACGVTPQAAARQARLPLMITHAPGHMFVTDRGHSEYEC